LVRRGRREGGILRAMTVTGQTPRPLPGGSEAVPRQNRRRDASAVLEVCPFLAVEDRSWRSAYAAREHRCQAVTPPALLAIEKQRQLCLVPAHGTCATYLAARDVATAANPPGPGADGASLWASSSPAPVVLEPARRMGALPTASARSGGQALLVGLMVLAFLVLVIARTQTPGGSSGPSPLVSGAAVAVATSSSAGTPTATGSPSTDPTPDPSSGPTPVASERPARTPSPSTTPSGRRYRVKSGETLGSIAKRFGTTVKKLAALNKIADPRYIKIGQVLIIP
jgi:LysM repeat protein